jgi:hypothetical protein
MRTTASRAATLVAIFATLVGVSCKTPPTDSETSAAGSVSAKPFGSTKEPIVVTRTDAGTLLSYPTAREDFDAGPLATGIPVPLSKVEGTINPNHLAPYAGPTGAVEGTVKVSGDAPPKQRVSIPFACGEASGTYGKAFREGNGRTLADALVAVTGYQGYVPPSGDVVPVNIRGCAFDRRTIALTFGQRIEVKNTDPQESFLPTLEGANMPAQLVAIPRGDAVKLYPFEVGHYALVDGMGKNWMFADVFVLRYATLAVTGLDGHFRITGIPVGKVKVSAYLPMVDRDFHPDVGTAQPAIDRDVEIKDGQIAQVDFVLPYKAPPPPPKAAPAPTGAVVR